MIFAILASVIDVSLIAGLTVGLWANVKDTVQTVRELHNDEN